MTDKQVAVVPSETALRLIGDMDDAEIERKWRIASALAKSGMFKDARQAEIAFAKMVVGRELGLGVTQSMLGLHLVQGGVMVHYSTLLRFVRAAGYNYELAEHDEERCTIIWKRDEQEVGRTTFTMQDAERADLTKRPQSGAKSMYEKYPKTMLLARAVSTGVREHIPEATVGIPVYVEGEIVEESEVAQAVGSGEAPGVELPEAVLEIIQRASALGHAAYSDRAAIEMTVGGQSEEYIERWVREATEDLDSFEQRKDDETALAAQDADVVDDLEWQQMSRRYEELREKESLTDDERVELDQLSSALRTEERPVEGQESLDV